MSAEENKLLARRLYEQAISRGDLAAVDVLVSPDFQEHNVLPVPPGRESFKHFVTMLRTAFPDLVFTIEDLVSEEDTVVVRGLVRGTHRGVFRGIAPTGRPVQWGAIHILRVRDGQFTERWVQVDMLGLLQQLGAITMHRAANP
ncbi:MAG TPA: ester cyclase [Chloroflexia bacterium]|nr:ester cyclase [Chloroflexia bacterium]